MAKLKNLLKKSLHASTSALLLVSSLLPATQIMQVSAATASTGVQQLQPATYDTYDTGNHTYTNGEINQTANYTTGSTDNHTVVASPWFNLVNDTASTVGYATFNGAIATNLSFSMTASIKVDDGTLGNFHNTGDALGFILTPSSTSQLANNVKSATGANLGINGLANTYFLGRDLYSNFINPTTGGAYLDGYQDALNGWNDGGGSIIAIRSTDSTGTLQSATYNSLGSGAAGTGSQNTTDGTAFMDAPDDNYTLGIKTTPATVTESVTVSWTPDATNTAPTGFNSGTLSFTLIPQTSNNGTKTITTKANLQNSMTFGFIGGTGGNYGNLSVSLNGASGTMGRGTSTVKVNYLNSVTNQPISGMPASTITANVDDTITATNATSSSSTASTGLTTYNFQAPTAPAGYTYASSNAVTVQNFQSSATNPNVINILYTPTNETAKIYQAFTAGTPGTTTVTSAQNADFTGTNFPTSIGWAGALNSGMTGTAVAGTLQSTIATGTPTTLNGGVDTPIAYPTLTTPAGYTLANVYYRNSDGSWTAYTDYASLQSAHPNFTVTYNTVVATYQPENWTATFTSSYASNTPGTGSNTGKAPAALSSISPISGLTGAYFIGQSGGPSTPTFTVPAGFTYTVASSDGSTSYSDSSLSSAVAHWSIFSSNTSFNITVNALTQTGTVTYRYDAGTPGSDDSTGLPSSTPTTAGTASALPADTSLSGLTNAQQNLPDLQVPAGYAVDYVLAPDGNHYDNFADAQAADDTNKYFNSTSNNWTVYLKAQTQTPEVTVQFNAESADGATVPSSFTLNFQDSSGNTWSGLTGSVIPDAIISATQAKLDSTIAGSTYANWFISQYSDPDGNVATDLATAVQNVGGIVLASSKSTPTNQYIAEYDYTGTISWEVPHTINFGNNTITGADLSLTGALDQALTVTDSRTTANLTDWSITVAETAPLTNGALDFSGHLKYKDSSGATVLSDQPTTIYSNTSPSTSASAIEVLAANSDNFILDAPITLQAPGTTYTGQLTWNLVVAP